MKLSALPCLVIGALLLAGSFSVLAVRASGATQQVTDVTATKVRLQAATFLNQSPGYENVPLTGAWVPLRPSLELVASGTVFWASYVCTGTNSEGTGPDYRIAGAVQVDGVVHGELMWSMIPQHKLYYQTHGANSLVEGVTGGPHTFRAAVFGTQGMGAFLECNLNVWAFD